MVMPIPVTRKHSIYGPKQISIRVQAASNKFCAFGRRPSLGWPRKVSEKRREIYIFFCLHKQNGFARHIYRLFLRRFYDEMFS